MKGKSIIIGLMLSAFIVGFGNIALEATKFYTCNVKYVQTDDLGVAVIGLSRPVSSGTSSRDFTVPVGEENRMLAVALTALASGLQVQADVDWSSNGSEIVCFRLRGN